MPSGRTAVSVLCASLLITTCAAVVAAPPASARGLSSALGADDTAGPAHGAVTVDPGSIDVSTSAAAVAVSVRLVDQSGVVAASARVSDSGRSAPLHLADGTPHDGTWTGTLSAPVGLPHGQASVVVDAVDAEGSSSSVTAPHAVAVLDAPPGAPSALSATAVPEDAGTLRLDWVAPTPNGGSAITAYELSATPVAGSAGAPTHGLTVVSPSTVTTTLSGLSTEARYVVQVAARNAAGRGPAVVADATTTVGVVTEPDAPTAVTAVALPGGLDVSWTAPTSDGGRPLTGYRVNITPRADVTRPPPLSLAATSRTTRITPLVNGVVYDVEVLAVNAVGTSLAGTTAGMPVGVPDAPTVEGVTAGDASVVVRWAAPESDGGLPVTAYEVTASPSGAVVTVAGDARSVTVAPLPNGVAATFTVVAVNLVGRSPASAASPPSTPRKQGRLVVVTQPVARVVHGTVTTVVAGIVDGAGAGIPGQRVDLLARVLPATTYKRFASATSGDTGRVTLRVVLPAGSSLRLHHPVGAVTAADVATRSVAVATRLSASARSARTRVATTVGVRGTVAPAHPVGSTVSLQRYVSGGWRGIAQGRLSSTTAYAIAWRPTTPGTYTLRVVKAADSDHATGVSPTWTHTVLPETAADVARDIINNSRITLATVHVGGVRDLAHARQNGVDIAGGRRAHRSSYGNAPGGYTYIDIRVLRAIRAMGAAGRTVGVSEIAGGSHARNSSHFSGRAVDITWVNGRHVARGSGYQPAVDACRAHGASIVYHPSYDPYGGHWNHIHCQWA